MGIQFFHILTRLRGRHRIQIVGAIIVLGGFLAASDELRERSGQIIIYTESLIAEAPILGMMTFVLLAAASAMLAFFSSAFLAPIAIFAWGKGGCLALLWLGWMLGGIASFCIGRYFGASVVAAIIGEEKIADWEQQLSGRARFRHILLFQATVPSEIPGYVLGILRYPFPMYLAALAITELPYAIAVIYLGDSFLEGKVYALIIAGIAVMLLGALLLKVSRKLWRGHGKPPASGQSLN